MLDTDVLLMVYIRHVEHFSIIGEQSQKLWPFFLLKEHIYYFPLEKSALNFCIAFAIMPNRGQGPRSKFIWEVHMQEKMHQSKMCTQDGNKTWVKGLWSWYTTIEQQHQIRNLSVCPLPAKNLQWNRCSTQPIPIVLVTLNKCGWDETSLIALILHPQSMRINSY